jgi:hypothetical protein
MRRREGQAGVDEMELAPLGGRRQAVGAGRTQVVGREPVDDMKQVAGREPAEDRRRVVGREQAGDRRRVDDTEEVAGDSACSGAPPQHPDSDQT